MIENLLKGGDGYYRCYPSPPFFTLFSNVKSHRVNRREPQSYCAHALRGYAATDAPRRVVNR